MLVMDYERLAAVPESGLLVAAITRMELPVHVGSNPTRRAKLYINFNIFYPIMTA